MIPQTTPTPKTKVKNASHKKESLLDRERIVIQLGVRSKNLPAAYQTLIWNPADPIALGHPLQWFCEKTQNGIRIRNVNLALDTVTKNTTVEISEDQLLKKGFEIKLPKISKSSHLDYFLRLHPTQSFSPVFEQTPENTTSTLHIYTCLGSWIKESHDLKKNSSTSLEICRNV